MYKMLFPGLTEKVLQNIHTPITIIPSPKLLAKVILQGKKFLSSAIKIIKVLTLHILILTFLCLFPVTELDVYFGTDI